MRVCAGMDFDLKAAIGGAKGTANVRPMSQPPVQSQCASACVPVFIQLTSWHALLSYTQPRGHDGVGLN